MEKYEIPIEPQLKDQWFVKMESLAEMALQASQDGRINFVSEQYKKVYEYWMKNPLDWNISRQIVWGIQIPAWFKNKGEDNQEFHIGKTKPEGDDWIQDSDTFDTWFSSGQWPVATLGFSDSEDFKRFYPTQLMETGRDLIFKWVPRMVIFGLYLTGEVPFKDIYMHGMVLDAKGQKMSKSKGNVLSPIDLADEYGMDALRMALIVGNAPGNDIPLSVDKVKAYKKFVNKLWNIARFVLENTDESMDGEVDLTNKHIENFKNIKNYISKNIESYQLHLASESLYQYVWHEYADVVLEEIKKDLTDENKKVLRYLFKQILIIAHPFMPFVTEEIWSDFVDVEVNGLLLVQDWE